MTATFLYIDPGTGSMLFSLFIGIATAAVFGFRALFVKIKFVLSGGKSEKTEDNSVIPYLIFSESKVYWNVFHSICEEFEARKIPLVYYACSQDDPVFSMNYEFIKPEYIGEGNKAFAKLNFLKADTVIATTPGLDVYQWKRSKNVRRYVHVPHSVDDLSSYRMFGLDHYDVVLANGSNQPECLHKLEQLRNQTPKEIPIVGCPYMDELLKKLNAAPAPQKNEKTTVLVAPSWGPNSILTKFGEKFLTAITKTDFEIIVRPHPQSLKSEKEMLDSLMQKFPDVKWNFDRDNFDVLNKADILISDFSGVIFDFTFVFNKPIIYADTKFDPIQYDADWLDEPMWSLRVLSSLGQRLDENEFDNLEQIIHDVLKSTSLKESRNKVVNEAWQFKGESAKRIVDYLTKEQ